MANARVSRRGVLSDGALVGTVALDTIAVRGGTISGTISTISGTIPWKPGEADPPTPIFPGPNPYFTGGEAAFIVAAVSRLIAQDEG
jgi:hypothetical protein